VIYVLGEIAVWMVLAAALGLGTGWLVWGWLAPRRPSRRDDQTLVRHLRTELAASREREAGLEARVATAEAARDELSRAVDDARSQAEAHHRALTELRGRVGELEAAARAAAPDDLKDISGVGPKVERMLHRVGIRTFRQLAELSDAEVDTLDAQLAEFKGRIRREGWVEQAKVLQADKYPEPHPSP
jgi:predicted flap endonuclease-1-like 5' DNA nuclease